MDEALLDGLHAGDKLHAACRAQKMAHHGLGGVDLYFLCMVAESQLDGLGLEQVVVMGAGSVGVDIVDCPPVVMPASFMAILHGSWQRRFRPPPGR